MNNYTDERTGLSVRISSDGSWIVTRPPLEPNMTATIMMTGKAQPAVPAIEAVSAQQQVDAYLAKYAQLHEITGPAVKAETVKPTVAMPVDEADEEAEEEADEPKKGKLPADFPYLALLIAGGVNTYPRLRRRIEAGTLTEIEGIATARATEIEAAYSA